jgi:hypothetical protein
MLTSEQVEKIAVDLINGAPPRVTGRKADAFRRRLARDLEFARERGWEVEVPFEMLRDE